MKIHSTITTPVIRARINYDNRLNEYEVILLRDDYREVSTYYTDSQQDAMGTAKAMIIEYLQKNL